MIQPDHVIAQTESAVIYGLSAALEEAPFLGALGWAQVAIGNLIAATVMGAYMWRTHPELKGELSYALGGQE